jgi:nitroimidazol reductase NimA-like FMN-containing flavoprotein (pyridoxamine 5'-phosphate oxidase superfamily)
MRLIQDYIAQTRRAVLGYVTQERTPVLRAIGSIASSGFDLYFYTRRNTAKVAHITANPLVSFFFQHEGQEPAAFKNVTYTGKAREINEASALAEAIEILSERSSKFKDLVEKGEMGTVVIYKVEPSNIGFLDYSRGRGGDAVIEIDF